MAGDGPRSESARVGVKSSITDRLADVLRAYQIEDSLREATPLGGGHIHQTWSVTTTDGSGYVLQQLNAVVFTDLPACQDNLRRLDDHFHRGERGERRADEGAAITIPRHLRTHTNGLHASTADDSVWRATHRVENSVALTSIRGVDDARIVARAFGDFATMLRSLPGPALRETIPRFHDFGWRVHQLRDACAHDSVGRLGAITAELTQTDELANELRGPAHAMAASAIHAVHNDAKVTNLLADAATEAVVAVVDLDTTMPGSALVDLGELVRSGASERPEDARDLDTIEVRRNVVDALIDGFCAGYRCTADEVDLLRYAGPVLAVENAMRFLADHLNGDIYFRATRPGQNLDRARVQLLLTRQLLRG